MGKLIFELSECKNDFNNNFNCNFNKIIKTTQKFFLNGRETPLINFFGLKENELYINALINKNMIIKDIYNFF